MTVRELIIKLQKFDLNLIVTYSTQEDTYEPSPSLQKYDFSTNYYTGSEFITIPKNQEFVTL